MLEPLAAALQATGLSEVLRASVWLYPLVNTGHVVGIALRAAKFTLAPSLRSSRNIVVPRRHCLS